MRSPTSASMNRRRLLIRAAKATGLGAAATFLPLTWKEGSCEGAQTPSRFKYSICNETFGDWPFERAFALAAQCGYRGIEIAPFTMNNYVTKIPAARRAEVQRLAERNGLEVVGLHWLLAKTEGFHITSPDAEVRRRTVEYLGELARFCADLGGKIMVFGSPKQRNLASGMSKAEGMKYASEVFRAVVPALEKYDVTIAMEPLGPSDTNFITTAADGVTLIDMVGSPRFRLLLDCKAMATEPTPIPELIHRYRELLVHFHVNDPNLQGPGFGKLDFVPIMKALSAVDYRGWVSVEVFDYTPGPERLARDSINYLRKCEPAQPSASN